MAKFRVSVRFDGIGYINLESDSRLNALEDAKQMDVTDIEFDSYTIETSEVREIEGDRG